MKVVVQKTSESSVEVDGKIVSSIGKGLTILVGFTEGDNQEIMEYIAKKVVNLRIFEDENGVMNKSLLEENGSILSISQFTLYGDTKKGNRPSYIKALNGEEAKVLYEKWNQELKRYCQVETGIFGADMKIHLVNVGPTTIIIERGVDHAQK